MTRGSDSLEVLDQPLGVLCERGNPKNGGPSCQCGPRIQILSNQKPGMCSSVQRKALGVISKLSLLLRTGQVRGGRVATKHMAPFTA